VIVTNDDKSVCIARRKDLTRRST